MAIITFLSDFGSKDHYVGAVKAKMLQVNPGLQIIDISHGVPKMDIAKGAFILKSVYHEFPKGSVHLVAVDCALKKQTNYVAMKMKDHFFVGANNGLLSLLDENANFQVVEIHATGNEIIFPARDILAEAAARLASGITLEKVGQPSELKQLIGRKSRASKSQINGQVIYIDDYGNLITNIEKRDFDILSKEKTYEVVFGREKFNQVNMHIDQVENGDCYLLFNSQGLLEIGINNGNAAQLLGLRYDSPVNIIFN